ncbi:MAG: hypothetical protein AAFN94_02545 [Pseudomonadota bacterium]
MKRALLTCALLVAGQSAAASNTASAATAFAIEQATTWLNAPVVLAALNAQNAEHAGIAQSTINEMDTRWRSEVGMASTPLISSVMDTAASEHLAEHVSKSNGMIREVFVMDAVGLNVASSAITSDYWQGDEAKFIQTYMAGPGSVHVSEVEFDESTQSYLVQVSMPITDPDSGAVIGAVTFGLDAQQFF